MLEDRQRLLDAALAMASAAGLILDAGLRAGGAPPVIIPLALAVTVPMYLRRRAPVPALAAIWMLLIAAVLVARPYAAATVVALVPLFTVAVTGSRRRSLIAGISGALVLAVMASIIEGSLISMTSVVRGLLSLGAVVVGDLVRARRELTAAQRDRARRAERDRDERDRRRAAAERLQIARELHDTLAHALVAINVRAGVAALLEEDATSALEEIKDVSSDALRDLRTTLDVLRDPSAPAPTAPTLDLAAIPDLMQTARSAGLDTEADVRLNGAMIPRAVGQASYRIVQESLTNIVRHAAATRATVAIIAHDQRLRITVTDDGRAAPTTSPADGHGIQGMLERAGALGGALSAGPLPDRGWRVDAELPLVEHR